MNEIIFFFYFTLQPPLTLVICNLVKHFQAQIKECCAKLQRFVPVLICSMAYSMYDVPIKDNTSRFAYGNLDSYNMAYLLNVTSGFLNLILEK